MSLIDTFLELRYEQLDSEVLCNAILNLRGPHEAFEYHGITIKVELVADRVIMRIVKGDMSAVAYRYTGDDVRGRSVHGCRRLEHDDNMLGLTKNEFIDHFSEDIFLICYNCTDNMTFDDFLPKRTKSAARGLCAG